MSDFGRFGATREGRERGSGEFGREREHGRGGESIFGQGGWGQRDRGFDERSFGDRDRERSYRDSRSGGWLGEGRTSGFDDRDRRRESGWGRDPDGFGRREDGRYGYDDDREGLPIDETSRLIASNKVEGTPVYGREGERLGTIYNFMVDKYSGQVQYAVMSYGGFLGLGQRYFPLPWRILTYDTREGGYHIDLTDRDLERAPSFGRHDEPHFDREYGRRVHGWYGLDY